MSDDIQMDAEVQSGAGPTSLPQPYFANTSSAPLHWTQATFGIPPSEMLPQAGPEHQGDGQLFLGSFGGAEPRENAQDRSNDFTPSSKNRAESIPAKMHLRRPGKDNWTYLGRALVCQDLTSSTPAVVVRSSVTDRILATFTERSSICVDKRGNFVVIASVEASGVVSYSLHAQSNSEALQILAAIELAAYKLGSLSGTENRAQTKLRRRIEKTIRDDRKRRHRRRKDDDALVNMLGQTSL